jgi:hypothetical protein
MHIKRAGLPSFNRYSRAGELNLYVPRRSVSAAPMPRGALFWVTYQVSSVQRACCHSLLDICVAGSQYPIQSLMLITEIDVPK